MTACWRARLSTEPPPQGVVLSPKRDRTSEMVYLRKHLSCPAVPASPEGALRTDLPFRVVNSLFVRTTQDAVCDDHRLRLVLLYESENLLSGNGIMAKIRNAGEPPFHSGRWLVFPSHNANCYFTGAGIVRSVECNGSHRISLESAARFLLERRAGTVFDFG
jgi:hypothetical protein